MISQLRQIRQQFIQKTAKQPEGGWAIKQYNDPKAHYRSFRMVMDTLRLSQEDVYCEIGCGGGVLLKMAMEKAGSGAALDHSRDMVSLSIENNRDAVDSNRLEILQGNAEALPWPSRRFTACACANMFFFVEHPNAALAEIFRVLAPGGRFSMVTAGQSFLTWITMGWLYGLNTYPDAAMATMMKKVGFSNIRVKTERTGLTQVCYGRK